MKKAISAILTLMLLVSLAVPVLAADPDFVIENGVLQSYKGAGGDIVIPAGVTEIASYAFSGNAKITGVTIPEGVTKFGDYCFEGCQNLVRVTIPKGMTDLGYMAFYNTPWLAGLGEFPVVNGTLIGYNGAGGAVAIPQGIKAIGGGVLSYNDAITSVVIPEGVTSIGYGAFAGCVNLTNVSVPNSVTEISTRTFADTPWVKTLGEFAILGGVLLKYNGSERIVTVPSGVKAIDAPAFQDTNVTTVTIPEGVTEIRGNLALCGAFVRSRLVAIALPRSLTHIGMFAFGDYAVPNSMDVYYAGTQAEWEQLRAQVESKDSFSNRKLFLGSVHYSSAMPAPETVGGFSDVYRTDYFAAAVLWAVSHAPQITNGVGGGQFGANATVDRAQAVTFLWRAAGCPAPKNTASSFSDVTDPGAWYYSAVLWASEQGITNGVGSGIFGLDGTLAYEQMLTFMTRAAGEDASGADWSAKALAWAAANGLTEDLSFSAAGDCPRCDVVYCLWKQMS